MSKTGKDLKIKRVLAGDKHLGGFISNAAYNIRPEVAQEVVTGQHELALVKATYVPISLNLTIKLQRLENFIADYDGTNKFGFVSAQGALATYDLYYTDVIDALKFADCITNSCRVTIPQRGAITAEVEVFPKTQTNQAYGSDPTPITEDPMTKTNLETLTLTLGGTDVKDIKADFSSVVLGVTHSIQRVPLGTSLPPSEQIQRQTVYTARIVRALKTQSWTGSTYAGTPEDLIVQINDNQDTPRKTKFTFADMIVNSHVRPIRELNMIEETIECIGKSLVLEAGA